MSSDGVYAELGVPTVVNAAGTKTRIGGSRIRPEAREAMDRAAESFVRLSDLQAAASDRIAEVTGAEAGYVTNGAAGALLLAAAASIAGTEPGTMARLPDTDGVADEIVMPRTHRTGYDHALRTAGATIVDVGTNDATLGTGARNVEPWEYADAIGEDTAAVAHVYKSYEGPPLAEVCDVAHEHDVPVIVDAAAELPPAANLSWFTDQGADLVAFSGGKGIRGPQTTGILAGRADLVESVAAQHLDTHATASVWDPPERLLDTERFDGVPRQGVGRPLKVGKEELVGLLAALDAFLAEDHEAIAREWRERAERIAGDIGGVDGLSTTIEDGAKSVAPTVAVAVDPEGAGTSAADLVLALRREDPRVFVGADGVDRGTFTVSPMCLTDDEADHVVARIRANLGDESGD
ncbi:aminotransferase class V-fold PLP-dependent enzyme [Halosimplex rubrum]|uniref:Aminotransferase class V-fold PLP-dependent enzyme n=1 Tax=Halosimplex rubrum TaxID=869889 RepID=A0A7D5T8C9_9EURY|nr:aminotransferase class V-fold PLP-dependent enzyme [Halosimplex rubrum]QLH79769.1 aminotransferase class V-fold PLP-dependent enzyme [Halosimplex rubrum]